MMAEPGKARNLGFFGSIYFVEGMVLTMFSSYLAIYLRQFKLSFTQIGIVSAIALLPTILKILIGALSDKWSPFGKGHRKPYILAGLILQGVGYAVYPFISPVDNYGLFIAVSLLIGLGMATYDTTTDGLGIDITPEEDRSLVQSSMVAGRASSMVIVGLVVGLLAAKGLWKYAFWGIAAFSFLELFCLGFVHEKPRSAANEFDKSAFKSMVKPAYLLYVLIGTLFPLALYSTYSMLTVYLKESFKIGMGTIALLSATYGIGAVAGGIAGGPLMKRFGRRASLYSAAIFTAIATLFIGLMPSAGLAWVVVPLFGLAFGYYETTYFALGMDFADPRIAAFMFSVAMAFGNLGIAAGSAISGVLVDKAGFQVLFIVYAAVNLLMVPLTFVLFRSRKDLVK
jgi:PAT family beta-lactamase induction signal transducer AmpG